MTDKKGNGLPPGATLEEFYAHTEDHRFIWTANGRSWPSTVIDRTFGKVGNIKASVWLVQNQPVHSTSWYPGFDQIIEDHLPVEGGWIHHPGARVFNQYRAPSIGGGDPQAVTNWLKLIRKVYPDDHDHIIKWFAHRRQKPHEKINHTLVLGGEPGIGKDTILAPVRHAVGAWNFQDISPPDLLERFRGFLKSVILRVNEARDMGDFDRYSFYEHMKILAASPPETLRVNEKNIREYYIANVTGIIITSNHKEAFHLPANDRRHYIAWSPLPENPFTKEYWDSIWRWYEESSAFAHIATYLDNVDLTNFSDKSPPPKTPAFLEIVDLSSPPEDAELADAIERLGSPDAVTLTQIQNIAAGTPFGDWLKERKNRRNIPHRFDSNGYAPVKNPDRLKQQHLWKVNNNRVTIYARKELPYRDQVTAARRLADSQNTDGTENTDFLPRL